MEKSELEGKIHESGAKDMSELANIEFLFDGKIITGNEYERRVF